MVYCNPNIKKLICEEGFFFADLGFYGEEVGGGFCVEEHAGAPGGFAYGYLYWQGVPAFVGSFVFFTERCGDCFWYRNKMPARVGAGVNPKFCGKFDLVDVCVHKENIAFP